MDENLSDLLKRMDENLSFSICYIKKSFNEGVENGERDSFLYYPTSPHPELVNGVRAHTDAGGVVLLFQDSEYDGLQFLKDGEWIDVQPVTNSVVINTGDQIEVLSNGRFRVYGFNGKKVWKVPERDYTKKTYQSWHRVLSREERNRRSIASFYNPSYKAAIRTAVVVEEGSEKK